MLFVVSCIIFFYFVMTELYYLLLIFFCCSSSCNIRCNYHISYQFITMALMIFVFQWYLVYHTVMISLEINMTKFSIDFYHKFWQLQNVKRGWKWLTAVSFPRASQFAKFWCKRCVIINYVIDGVNHICTWIRTVCVCVCDRVFVFNIVFVCMCFMCVIVCVFMCVCLYACVCWFLYVCLFMFVCVCMHVHSLDDF